MVDCMVMVAMPPEAFFVAMSMSVPGPVTLNVSEFVAVVTILLLLSSTLDVTSEVALPSAAIVRGFAVFMTFAGEPGVVVTATELWARFVAVVVTVAVPSVRVDCKVTVAIPLAAFFVVVPSSVP